jgi:hypothetical protein
MRFHLRTLMIVMALGPPLIAFTWLKPEYAKMIAMCSAIWLAHGAFFFALAHGLNNMQRKKAKD